MSSGKFSLPALIFTSLATLDLSNVKWSFLLAILVSKTIIFALVLITDFVLNRTWSRAAIFAIYSTQTNDFGIGLPILQSVFGQGHEFVGLLYLVAPISLIILNPIGFILLEVDKGQREKVKGGSLSTFLGVLKGLLLNPVVGMTVLGVLGNFAFSSNPPKHLTKFLKALGAAFSALAPFGLGLSMVGKVGGINGETLKPILALVGIKNMVTPVLTYFIVDQVDNTFFSTFICLGEHFGGRGTGFFFIQLCSSSWVLSHCTWCGIICDRIWGRWTNQPTDQLTTQALTLLIAQLN